MGTIGSLLLVTASLSDRYGSQRAVALSRSNVIGSLCAGIAPIIVSVLVNHWGWRGAFHYYPVHFCTIGPFSTRVFFLRFNLTLRRRQPRANYRGYVKSVEPAGDGGVSGILHYFGVRLFWKSLEGFSANAAPDDDGKFLAAMMLGRWLGSWLASRMRSEEIVLGSSRGLSRRFLLHWWIPHGVFFDDRLISGKLGAANLYPQPWRSAAQNADESCQCQASLASGLAILLLPLLGGLADLAGLWYAYGIVVILLVLIRSGIFMARSTSPIQSFALEPHRTK